MIQGKGAYTSKRVKGRYFNYTCLCCGAYTELREK